MLHWTHLKADGRRELQSRPSSTVVHGQGTYLRSTLHQGSTILQLRIFIKSPLHSWSFYTMRLQQWRKKKRKGGSVDTVLASNLSSTPGSHKVEGEMDFCVLPTCAVESTPPTLNKQCDSYFFIYYPHGSYSLGENQSGLEFCLSQSSKMCFLEAPLVCF